MSKYLIKKVSIINNGRPVLRGGGERFSLDPHGAS